MIGTSSMCKFTCFLYFVTAVLHTGTCSPWLHLGTNGYRGLVVAVHPSVSEQQQFTNHIENLLNWTSHAFHDMTPSKLLFEEVIIVLPFTWTKYFSGLPDIGDIFSKADIRVYGSGGHALPYTVQYSDCERQGRYIQMTDQFVHTADVSSGSILAQEFARYRYGIFDDLAKDTELSDVPLVLTTQGFRCDGRSKWEILANHPDLRKQSEYMANENTRYHTNVISPIFKFYRTRPRETYMLIFDTSRTLWNNITPGWTVETLGNLTIGRLVQQFLPNDSHVGFITYSDTATIMRGLTQISPFVRENFFEGISIGVKGTRQALANAIAKASEVLKERHLGSKIIVVSDGNNDVAPPLENVTPFLLDNMISASVMSPSMRYETHLKTLATATDGEVYFLDSNWLNTERTQTAMLDHLTSSGRIQVYQGDILISKELTYQLNVYVDEFLGEQTLFEFEGNHLTENGINIFLATSSDGVVYNLKNAIRRGTAIHFPVHDETGNWTILFANPARLSSRVRVRVTSKPRRVDLNPVLLESWVDVQRDVDYSTVRIFANLHKGPDAVLDAKITAFVTTPQQDEIAVILKDAGTGADLIPNDGVYSAYFTEFKADGIYTVLTQAQSSKYTRTHVRQRKSNSQDSKTEHQEDYFTRYKYAGSFTIHDYKGSMNKIPPCQVTDLTVVQDSISTLTLSWTAPGSNLDVGIVTLYDLRMGFTLPSDSDDITDQFKSWRSILTSHIIQGTLEPSTSGSKMNVTIIMSDLQSINGNKIYFALRSQDRNGNPSKISNIATFETQVHTLITEVTEVRVAETPLLPEVVEVHLHDLETTILPKIVVKDESTSVKSKEYVNEISGSSESKSEDPTIVPESIVKEESTSSEWKESENKILHSSKSESEKTTLVPDVFVTNENSTVKWKKSVNEISGSSERESQETTLVPDVVVTDQSTSVKSKDYEIESESEEPSLFPEITKLPETKSVLPQEVTKGVKSETSFLPEVIVTDKSTSIQTKDYQNKIFYSSESNFEKTTAAPADETESDFVNDFFQNLLKVLSRTSTTQGDTQQTMPMQMTTENRSTEFEDFTTLTENATDRTTSLKETITKPVLVQKSKPGTHSSFMEESSTYSKEARADDLLGLNKSEMNTSSDNYSMTFPYHMEEDNETRLNMSYMEMMAPGVAMIKKEETFAETNVRTSSVVAAWAGGFCLTFIVIAGIAMMIRSLSKRGAYDVSKLEEDAENCTMQELIGDESTTIADDSF